MHALTLSVPAAAVDALADMLEAAPSMLSLTIEDGDAGTPLEQPVFDEPDTPPGAVWLHARIDALFSAEADATASATAVAARFGELVRVCSIAPVDERDWVRATQNQFGPTEIDAGFWIVPSWSAIPHGASHAIRLDPGLAFGTGTHPTTRMCLRWIARQAALRPEPWRRVLDYGCGSGVLGIAAAVFGASEVDAIDIDPTAVESTRANAAANGVCIGAGGADRASGRYALVLANILATPLTLLAPLLAAKLDAGADLVLSGILERQADALCVAYAPWLELRVADRDDGWILMAGSVSPARGMA